MSRLYSVAIIGLLILPLPAQANEVHKPSASENLPDAFTILRQQVVADCENKMYAAALARIEPHQAPEEKVRLQLYVLERIQVDPPAGKYTRHLKWTIPHLQRITNLTADSLKQEKVVAFRLLGDALAFSTTQSKEALTAYEKAAVLYFDELRNDFRENLSDSLPVPQNTDFATRGGATDSQTNGPTRQVKSPPEMNLFEGEWYSESRRAVHAHRSAVAALYQLAMGDVRRFAEIVLPPFLPKNKVPVAIRRWWDEKQRMLLSPEQLAEQNAWLKRRRQLAKRGTLDESLPVKAQLAKVKQMERTEQQNIQFEYWLEHSMSPWFKQKYELLQRASAQLGEVVTYHVPEFEVAAAMHAAKIQESFARELQNAPLPPSFAENAELAANYQNAMKEQAAPFFQGAIRAYEHCVHVAENVRLNDGSAEQCKSALNALHQLDSLEKK